MPHQPNWGYGHLDDCLDTLPALPWDFPFLETLPAMNKSKYFHCDWPDCPKKDVLMTFEEHKLHTEAHGRDVRSHWKPNKRCPWPGCSSKALHKTPKFLDDHLNNIHINPLICTRDDCKYKKPFPRKSDLQRHIDSVHMGTTRIRCPYPSCEHKKMQFCRRDKWFLHLRDHHKTELCPYAHCQSRRDPPCNEDADKHIGKAHSVYECALRSCNGSVSQFSDCGLLEHLQVDHRLTWEQVLRTRDAVKEASDVVVRDKHVVEIAELSDCRHCGK
jgi:hypothetical protein